MSSSAHQNSSQSKDPLCHTFSNMFINAKSTSTARRKCHSLVMSSCRHKKIHQI